MAMALAMKPWRTVGHEGPPWPWVGAWAVMPLLWTLDITTGVRVVQPMSGAAMLVLLAGWPLTVVALLPVAVLAALAGHLDWAQGTQRLLWLGLAPATLVMVLGAAVRRWLPNHLFVYILGRGFFAPLLASLLAGSAAALMHADLAGVGTGDLLIARLLVAFGEALLTGMVTATLVAFRPHWLATYSDRLYLPRS